jgi:hypothetical protein
MIHPLALVAAEALRQEFETESYYDRGRRYPSVDVKNRAWFPRDIPWDDLRSEFDNVDVVKTWIEELTDHSEYDQLYAAEECARASWWEDVSDLATEHFGSHVEVYGEGRSGGHLVVHGIGSPDDWYETTCEHVQRGDDMCWDHACDGFEIPDIDRVRQWAEFREYVEDMKGGFAYMVGWDLIVNVHNHIHNLEGAI